MPEGNDNESWALTKAVKQAAFKLRMKEFKAAKHICLETENTGKKLKSDGGKKNLSLAKSFSSPLSIKAQMSDAEAADIVNSVMKENIYDDNNNYS